PLAAGPGGRRSGRGGSWRAARGSRPRRVQGTRKRDRLADVRDAADPRHRALDAEPEAGVHERAVLAQVEIPAVGVLRQLLRTDPREQLVVVVFALAAPDDFAVPFGREHVVVE